MYRSIKYLVCKAKLFLGQIFVEALTKNVHQAHNGLTPSFTGS